MEIVILAINVFTGGAKGWNLSEHLTWIKRNYNDYEGGDCTHRNESDRIVQVYSV